MGLQSLIRYLLLWPSAVLLSLLVIIWIISPFILLQQTNKAIEPIGYKLGENSYMRFNPFTQSFSASNIELLEIEETEPQAEIEHLLIDINAFALIDEVVNIERIEIENSRLRVLRQDKTFSVAGYPIVSESEDNDAANGSNAKETTDAESNWSIQLDAFKLLNFNTVFTDQLQNETKTHSFLLEQFELNEIIADLTKQRGSAVVLASLNDSKISSNLVLDLEDSQGEIEITLALESVKPREFNYMLAEFFPDPLNDTFSGDINLNLKKHIRLLENSATEIELESLAINISNIKARTSGIDANLEAARVSLSDAKAMFSNGDLQELSVTPSLDLSSLKVTPTDSSDTLLAVAAISADNISVTQSNTQPLLTVIPNLKIDSILGSQPALIEEQSIEAMDAIFDGESLTLENIVVTEDNARIETISLGQFSSQIPIDENKTLSNLVLPVSSTSEEKEAVQTEAPLNPPQEVAQQNVDEENAFSVAISQFRFEGPGTIKVSDRSVQPNYQESVIIQSLELGGLDTGMIEKNTPFNGKIKIGKYGKIDLSGHAKLFSEKLNLDLNTQLNELALPKISPYLRDAAGFDILAGQFDLNTQLKIVEDELDGNSTLFLRGIEVETGTDVKRGDLSEQTFIPLNLALGALKDGDGNIEMDVDLSGNVNDPNVGLNGFMYLIAQKAALSAAESYAINTFVPYANIVSLAKVAGSFALKVRVDDLIYPSRATGLNSEQQEFVKNLGILMQEKPDIHVKLCPIATKNDLPKEEVKNADLTDSATIESLKRIAKDRGENLKEELIKNHQIASSRLLVCQARADDQEDAKPRIEFII